MTTHQITESDFDNAYRAHEALLGQIEKDVEPLEAKARSLQRLADRVEKRVKSYRSRGEASEKGLESLNKRFMEDLKRKYVDAEEVPPQDFLLMNYGPLGLIQDPKMADRLNRFLAAFADLELPVDNIEIKFTVNSPGGTYQGHESHSYGGGSSREVVSYPESSESNVYRVSGLVNRPEVRLLKSGVVELDVKQQYTFSRSGRDPTLIHLPLQLPLLYIVKSGFSGMLEGGHTLSITAQGKEIFGNPSAEEFAERDRFMAELVSTMPSFDDIDNGKNREGKRV